MTSAPAGGVSPAVLAQRFAAQRLSGAPATSPVDVAGRLLAVQGQDPRGARLAIRARTSGLTAADVDKALTDRSLLITWLNRGTLHLIRSEDYWLLQQLTVRTQYLRACLRHAARGGVSAQDAEKAVGVIAGALASDGPLTRAQLRERIAGAGIRATAMAPLHLITLTCLRGLAVRGPMIGAQHAYVLVRDWVGSPPASPDHDRALAELARRYLAGHGPATDRDLAKWAGLPVGQVRRGLSGIASQLRERPGGLVELAGAPGPDEVELPGPTLLGSYDPVLHGWESRAQILGQYQQIVTVNGLFRPFALVGGRAAGTWSWTAGQVELEAFDGLARETRAALAAEARDVQRFLSGEPEQAG
jgi:Winged helix DNA-binding domain